MSGIGILSNPYSKQNRSRKKRLSRLKSMAPDTSLAIFPSTIEEMDNALTAFRSRNIDILAINGGDGTVHIALSRMMAIYESTPLPDIAVLRGGTMNQTVTNLGIRGNTFSILRRVIRRYETGEQLRRTPLPLLEVDGDKYGFIFGLGSVVDFMDIYHRSGSPSPFTAFKTVLTVIGSTIIRGKSYRQLFTPGRYIVKVNNYHYRPAQYIAALVSTLKQVGLGFTLMHRARENNGDAHMLAFHNTPKVLARILRARYGRSLPPDTVDDAVGRTFTIYAEEPFRYTLDGDIYSSPNELDIRIGPTINIITE